MRATIVLVLLVLMSMAPLACGSDSEQGDRGSTQFPGGSNAGPTTDGSDVSGPLRNQAVPGPKEAVERLIRWGRSQSIPPMITLYTKATRDELGTATLAGALQQQAQIYATPGIRVTSVEPTDVGVLVMVRRQARGAPPQDSAYLLVREKGRWLISYDSLLAQGIQSFTVQRIQRKRKSKSPNPPADVIAEGRAASQRYVELSLPEPLRTKVAPPS